MSDTNAENQNIENLLAACERDLKSSKPEVCLEAIKRLKEIGEPSLPLLLTAAKDRNAKVSEAAAQAVSVLGDTGVLALRDLFYAEIEARRKRKKSNVKLMFAVIFFCAVSIRLQLLLPENSIVRSLIDHLTGISAYLASLLIICKAVYVPVGIISVLQQTDDVKIAGLFALCLRYKDKEVQKIARYALQRLLPRVQASDKPYFSTAEMQALIDALRKQKGYPTLMISLLKGLEQIGDERALANVAALINDPDVFPEVRRAARECLPFLEVRAEQVKMAQTLLRASSGYEISPETLLRPVQGVATNDAHELLRPKL